MDATFKVADFTACPMSDLLSLEGRIAVVTGGARGLGLAIARRFVEAGARVVLADLDLESVRGAAESLERGAGDGRRVDVTDSDAIHALAADVASEYGALDIWVNNAGIFPREDPATVDAAQIERVLAVNLTGTYIGIQAAARQMAKFGGGVIINITSASAFRGRGTGSYAASKWAVRGLTHGLSPSLARQGIRLIALAPAVTRTEGAEAAWGPDSTWSAIASGVPLGREGVADDVARVAAFVASDAAAYMTGSTIPIDGGALSVSTLPATE